MDKQTDGQTDGRHQTYNLPCFMVDKNWGLQTSVTPGVDIKNQCTCSTSDPNRKDGTIICLQASCKDRWRNEGQFAGQIMAIQLELNACTEKILSRVKIIFKIKYILRSMEIIEGHQYLHNPTLISIINIPVKKRKNQFSASTNHFNI